MERLTVSSNGTGWSGHSGDAAVSDDGRFVFVSTTAQVAPDDTGAASDIYQIDTQTGAQRLVTRVNGGGTPDGQSRFSVADSAGDTVLFLSDARTLVPSADPGTGSPTNKAFLTELSTGRHRLVSGDQAGSAPDGNVIAPFVALSGDGRYAMITTEASNLGPTDTNGFWDVYRVDLATGQRKLVSLTDLGQHGNNHSIGGGISDDGRFVVFHSFADNLGAGTAPLQSQIYLRDMLRGETTLISQSTRGVAGNSTSTIVQISGDGNTMAFLSAASNLVDGDNNDEVDLFVWTRSTGTMARIDICDCSTHNISLSDDGRYVVFDTTRDLTSDDTNDLRDIYVFDRDTGRTELVTKNANGTVGNGNSDRAVISGDGRSIVFESLADNFVSEAEAVNLQDVFKAHNPLYAGPSTLPAPGQTLTGTGKSETQTGSAGPDVMDGQAGADVMHGGDGDDSMTGGPGFDTVNGGDGDDTIEGNAGNDLVNGGDGNDDINGGQGADTLNGDDGDDTIHGMIGYDSISGGAGQDTLRGNAGNDTVSGGDGDDDINGGQGADTLLGDDGDDSIDGQGGYDSIDGGDGDDALRGGLGNDSVNGGGGADTIDGGQGNDDLSGGAENDTITGSGGNDTIHGGDGADQLFGNHGNDRLFGDAGNDLMDGGYGHDTMRGGANDDTMSGQAGQDHLFGGTGNDILNGNAGDDAVSGDAGLDILFGGHGADTLMGGADNDVLNGGSGYDSLSGGAHDDTLSGGDGNDRLDGGSGNDRLDGGNGADTFVFNAGQDRIVQFQNNTDTIEIDAALLAAGTTVAQVVAMAQVTGTDTEIDFGSGNTLTIEGLSNTAQLLDDLVIL